MNGFHKTIFMKKALPNDVYELLADNYSKMIETKPHNAYYERPAMQSLLPDVTMKTILDAGCGPGIYAQLLVQRGAQVIGIDASEKMLTHARKRLGDAATFLLANMDEPMSLFENQMFDGILSPLAISYVEKLDNLFAEFCRILRPNGWFIFSTEHPFFSYNYFGLSNYFEQRQIACEWNGFGIPVTMPSYYRSLGALTGALTDNGFIIEKILEPKPTEEFKDKDPRHYLKLMDFPGFICIKARKI